MVKETELGTFGIENPLPKKEEELNIINLDEDQYAFTADELYEIEKTMDIHAALHTKAFAETIAILTRHPAAKEYADKISNEAVRAYDVFRTISAKCTRMRNV